MDGRTPFLVSSVCLLMDDHDLGWNTHGVNAAVRMLLKHDVSLFESLTSMLEGYSSLKQRLKARLLQGEQIPYLPYDEAQKQLRLHGFVSERNGHTVVANKIFETLLRNQFNDEEYIGSRGLSENIVSIAKDA